jgi:hypothetical protein
MKQILREKLWALVSLDGIASYKELGMSNNSVRGNLLVIHRMSSIKFL